MFLRNFVLMVPEAELGVTADLPNFFIYSCVFIVMLYFNESLE